MKKLNFFTFLVSLVVISFMSSCSSTKYGAHFQQGKYQPHAYESRDLSAEKASELEEASEDAEMAAKSAEAEPLMDIGAEAPVASLKEVNVATEIPKKEDLTRHQQEVVQEVKNHLQSMTWEEKRELRREIRKLKLSDYRRNMLANSDLEMNDLQQETTVNIVALILAIVLPPLGVFIHQGEINSKFWISLLLTLLFFVPGVIYSVLVVLGVI